MVVSFATGTVTLSPLNGAALSFATTVAFWALLELRDAKR
jgi:hypothetical protein